MADDVSGWFVALNLLSRAFGLNNNTDDALDFMLTEL